MDARGLGLRINLCFFVSFDVYNECLMEANEAQRRHHRSRYILLSISMGNNEAVLMIHRSASISLFLFRRGYD